MNITWFLLPLAAGVSLVWNASRYESTEVILRRSGRMFVQILFFMVLILGVLFALFVSSVEAYDMTSTEPLQPSVPAIGQALWDYWEPLTVDQYHAMIEAGILF